MNLLEFKDVVVTPIKKTIEQLKSPTLAQFKSLDDIKTNWIRAEGLEMSLNHIEATYKSVTEAQPTQGELVQEILPPE